MKSLITSAMLLLALLLPAAAAAHDFEVGGIYYNINGDEATVTFRGTYTHSYSDEYTGDVTIPSVVTYGGTTYAVTAIGERAFLFCDEVTSVTIPNSVTSIGKDAFYACAGLTELTIPKSVTSIGDRVFVSCVNLTSLTVASGNSHYDSRGNCNAIIETASNTLIAGCQNTVIPRTVTAIGAYAFGSCRDLTDISIPSSVTSIGAYAFEDCYGLTNMTIPNSVTEIGIMAFYNCIGLTSLTISNAVTHLADNVFGNCSGLTDITIPNSVITIGKEAFGGCDGLTSVTIPNSVTTIGKRAFWSCENLASVNFGNSVTTIDEEAFRGCLALTSMTIPATVTAISNLLFVGCSNLVSVTIPNTVTSIGAFAFMDCISLTDVTIPNSVQTIGIRAFSGCQNLTDITIPNSVTSFGEAVFRFCINLEGITVESGNTVYDSRGNCNAIIETASNTLIAGCQNTVIPNSVKAIGDEAFLNISSLRGITIPNSVISIGEWAFHGCSGLEEVTMGKNVITIDGHAFRDCYSLKSITIPATVTTIGEWAFDECRSLTDVYSYITDLSKVSYGTYPFYLHDGNYSGRTLHVPQGMAGGYQADGNWHPYFGQIVDDLMPEDYPQGDVNHDGEVNIADVNAVIDIILGGNTYTPEADVNGDGEVNIADINVLIDIILGGGSHSQDDHEYVDLGLPSGTLWATCNIGATSPEQYGDYFAWGETVPKEDYTWETYLWCNGAYKSMTKYCTKGSYGTVDHKIKLDPEDDAATVNWGPSWCMPSVGQIKELMEKCSIQWTTTNGENGLLVIGTNGNTMFLPAAGALEGSSHEDAGVRGYYWSCALDPDANMFAFILGVMTEGSGQYFGLRDHGYTVRAVRSSGY